MDTYRTKGGPNSIDDILGAKLREIRKEKKITQVALANAIGVTFQQVQKYELGSNRLSASRLCLIAHTLDVDISIFFNDDVHECTAQLAEKIMDSESLNEMVSSYKSIKNPSTKKKIQTLVKNSA